MAKKTNSPSTKNSDLDRGDIYPWLRLLELEVHPVEHPVPKRSKGRPPNPFPRKPIHVTLTDDELSTLDELATALSEGLNTRLHRGHVIAFLAFYLRSRLQKGGRIGLPQSVISLSDLARYLDRSKD